MPARCRSIFPLALTALMAWATLLPLSAQAQRATHPAPRHDTVLHHIGCGPRADAACLGHPGADALELRLQLRRELRFLELREGGTRPAPADLALPQPAARPPTPVGDIQPAYRDASQVRPEFLRPQDPPRR